MSVYTQRKKKKIKERDREELNIIGDILYMTKKRNKNINIG